MPNYNDYSKLISKICWSWHKTTGIEFETLKAEANVAYAECLPAYDSKKAKFSTFLWRNIDFHFKNIVKKGRQNRYDGVEVNLEGIALSSKYDQEKECILRDTLTCLSKEAREITSIVLEAPADLIAMLPKPRLSKHQLTKYLRIKGWKLPKIARAFNEIGKALDF